ncbi:DUF433 domain-containing protein [Leptodesmis sichuanensis]|uniref:DUF433 domain-containing protein n=1 Tax=Leptodesmis sichuanensis TaxID=2906798 RepID=UPI0036F2A5A5
MANWRAILALRTGSVSQDSLPSHPDSELQRKCQPLVHVGKTRVTLDTVVAVFKQGSTAEEIVYRYPTLKLADVYATIGSRSLLAAATAVSTGDSSHEPSEV